LSFSGIDTKDHALSVTIPGIAALDIGCPMLYYDTYYGEAVILETAEDVEALLSYASIASKPIAIYVNYSFSFMDENE